MRSSMNQKGSMTVEAACVMSLILLVLIGTLYLCFFVHNRAWLTAAAWESALSGSMEGIKENGKVLETAQSKSSELGNIGFFGVENLSVRTEEEKDSVKVIYEFDTIASYGGLNWHLKTEAESKIIRPVNWIRKTKAAADLLKGAGAE